MEPAKLDSLSKVITKVNALRDDVEHLDVISRKDIEALDNVLILVVQAMETMYAELAHK